MTPSHDEQYNSDDSRNQVSENSVPLDDWVLEGGGNADDPNDIVCDACQ